MRIIWRRRLVRVAALTMLLCSPCAYGDLLYVGARSNYVTRVDENTGAQLGTFASGFYGLESLTLGPDGDAYVSGIKNNVWGVFRFDPITGQEMIPPFETGDLLDGIRFGPDGKFYGVDEWTGDLTEYTGIRIPPKRVVLAAAYSGQIGSFDLGEHNDFFAVVSSRFSRFDLGTGQQLGSTTDLTALGLSGYGFDQMTLGPDGKLYVAYSYHSRGIVPPNGGVMQFDPMTGNLIDTVINDIPAFGAEAGGSLGLAFGPDGDLYIGSQYAKAIFRYDPNTWNRIGQIPLPGFVPSATYLTFLPVPEPTFGPIAFLSLLCLGRYRRHSRLVANSK